MDSMTDAEINIAIAEACGWKIHEWGVTQPDGLEVSRGYMPVSVLIGNYCGDLNAMHEAEKVLGHHLFDGTWLALLRFVVEQAEGQSCNLSYHHRATARQRAEAFLRTLGKWREHP